MSDVTDTLNQLAGGQLSLDDAAGQFRNRQWPVRLAHQAPYYPDGDPEPEPDGGFGEVEAAFAAGLITQEQYSTLAAAAAEGMKAQMGSADGASSDPQTKAGGPPLTAGSWVKWQGGTGRIDLIVKDGTVPGVDEDVTGTDDAPAARVTVYEGGKATGKKAGVKLSALSRTFPQRQASGGGESKQALVGLLADHEQRAAELGWPAHAVPGARAVLTVFDRGVTSWPGEAKTLLTAGEWAQGRVTAFLNLAAGQDVPEGYTRDVDLLPEGHPARTR